MESPCPADAKNAVNGTNATSPSLGSAQGLSLGDILLRQAVAMEQLCEMLGELVLQNSTLLDVLAPADDEDDEEDVASRKPQYLSGKSR